MSTVSIEEFLGQPDGTIPVEEFLGPPAETVSIEDFSPRERPKLLSAGMVPEAFTPQSFATEPAVASSTSVPPLGFQKVSQLPRFAQAGYNQSITGLAQQIITGEQPYDLSGYEPGAIEDIAATVVSFLMPVDMVTVVAGGGLGGAAAKGLVTKAASRLVAAGVKSSLAKRAATKGLQRALQGAGALGTFSGVSSAAAQEAQTGQVNVGEVARATAKGVALGAATGGVGGSLPGRIAPLVGEIGVFGTIAPALEGKRPTTKDYLHAAGVILGIRAVHASASSGLKALRLTLAKDIRTEVQENGKTIAEAQEIVAQKHDIQPETAKPLIRAPETLQEAVSPEFKPPPPKITDLTQVAFETRSRGQSTRFLWYVDKNGMVWREPYRGGKLIELSQTIGEFVKERANDKTVTLEPKYQPQETEQAAKPEVTLQPPAAVKAAAESVETVRPAWATRRTDLARIHIKQGKIPSDDPNFREVKRRIAGKETLADFTQEEMTRYEVELDRLQAEARGEITAYPKTLSEKISGSVPGVNLASGITVIENMGPPGKALGQAIYDVYARKQLIKGQGDLALHDINSALGDLSPKDLTGIIDPYLSEGMNPKYLADPRTKQAAAIWKGYTDSLHEMRGRFDTWVLVNGERQPAQEHYFDNWIRYQLNKEARAELSKGEGSEIFSREVQRLIEGGEAKNVEQAGQLIGEWLRLSPFYEGPVRYGSADRPRLVRLSPDMYERDFTKIAPGIIRRYSSFLAAAETFGQDMTKRDRLLGSIAIHRGQEKAAFADQVVKELIQGEQLTATRQALQTITSGVSQALLSSPRSGMNNVLYSNNTDLPIYGVRAWVGGWLGWMDRPFQYGQAVREARRVGQIEAGTFELEAAGLRGKLAKVSPGLMGPSEFLNRTRSVVGARIAATQAGKILKGNMPEKALKAMGGNIRAEQWARHYLRNIAKLPEQMVADIARRGYLTAAEMDRVMAVAPSITQGSADPIFMAKIMRGEFGGPLASLKKMAYRATAAFHVGVIKPLYKGQVGPLVKWLAATTGAGEAMYYMNYLLFGWEHPHKDDPLVERLARSALRGQGFGIINDWFEGYGMVPVVLDKMKDVYRDIAALLTGKQTTGQTLDDVLQSTLAIYRDAVRVKRAHFDENSDEYRRWARVRTLVRNWKEEAGYSAPRFDDSFLTERSPYYREIRDSFFNGDPQEFRRTMLAALEAIKIQYMAMGLSEPAASKKARKGIDQVISGLHPVTMAKRGENAGRFMKSLSPADQKLVMQAANDYNRRIKLLRITNE